MRKIMKHAIVSTMLFMVFLLNPRMMSAIDCDRLADRVSMDTAKVLEEKYHVQLIGTGGGAMHGVEQLSLSFEISPPVSIHQARKIAVDSAEIFLGKINSDKALRPYLAEYPFPVSRINLNFFVKNASMYKTSETLSVFGLVFCRKRKQMMVDYAVYDKEMVSKEVLVERYEEAKHKITQEGTAP